MSTVIDLHNLQQISRGDRVRQLRYLKQFVELIPSRTQQIKEALAQQNRTLLRKLIHQLSPQIQFFGINDFARLKRKLELEYQEIDYFELQQLVNDLLERLDLARQEVEQIIDADFNETK